jgi:Spy/CpxP family protein refolding chaperone
MKKLCCKKKLIVLGLAVLASGGICLAQGAMADSAGGNLIDKDFETCARKFISKRLYNRIEATDEQRQKLDTIWTGTMEGTRPMREELRRGLLDLSELMANGDVPDDQIVTKVHELRALHEKIMDQRVDSMLKARKVFTAEQRKELQQRFSDILTGNVRPKRLGAFLNENI